MNYKRILISEAEKKRILGMHTKAKINPSTRLVNEQEIPVNLLPSDRLGPDSNSQNNLNIPGVNTQFSPEDWKKAVEDNTKKAVEDSKNKNRQMHPTQNQFPSCVSEKKGYKKMTGKQIIADFSEKFSCLTIINKPGESPIDKFLFDELFYMVSTYGGKLIIYDISLKKAKFICNPNNGGFSIYSWACKCTGGKYKPTQVKEIKNKEYFTFKNVQDDSEKDCKPTPGAPGGQQGGDCSKGPMDLVLSMGLNWKETRQKWIDAKCNGTTPCILGDAKTNINLRNAICKGTWDPKTGQQKGGTTPGDQSGEQKGGTTPGDIVLVDPTNPANSKMICFFKKLVELKVISRIPVNYKFPKACSTTQAANVLPDDNNLKTCFTEMIGVIAPYLVNIELVQIKVIIIEILVCIFGSEDKIPPVLINLPINIPGKGDIGIQLPDKGGEDWDQWRGGLFPITEKPEGTIPGTPPRTAG